MQAPFQSLQSTRNRLVGTINRNGVLLEQASTIPPELLQWYMYGWLPRGKFVTLSGPPATAKTMLAMMIAATMSSGGAWPDGTLSPIGKVAIWSGEDGVSDTIIPRLMAAGANMDNILIVRTIREGATSPRI